MSATIKRLNKAADVPNIQVQWLIRKPQDVLTSAILGVLDEVDSMPVDNFKAVVFRAARATVVCDYIELLDIACKHWGYDSWSVVLRLTDNPELPEDPLERRALLDQQHESRIRVINMATPAFPQRAKVLHLSKEEARISKGAQANEFGVMKGLAGKHFAFNKNAKPKCYLQRTPYFKETNPHYRNQLDKAWGNLPEDVRDAFLEELKFFEGRAKISESLFIRFVTDLDQRYQKIASMMVLNNVALALGYSSWDTLRTKRIDEVFSNAEIKRMHEHDRLMQKQEAQKGRKVVPAPVNHEQFIESYFYQQPEILGAIEDLLKEYADEYLDEAMRRYKARNEPGAPEYRMDGEEVWLSFGIFIRAVRRLEVFKQVTVDDQSIKRLARMLYCWHFRRLLASQIMITNCKRIPRRYRTNAYKNMYFNSLDQVQEDEGPDYSDIPFDDSQYEPEDPNDNFGNC